jgi:hypothetical protein
LKAKYFSLKKAPAVLFFFLALVGARGDTRDAYLIPQTIFVGDKGRLVVPLGRAFAAAEAFVRTASGELPETADLVITRIELENRNEPPRLLVDFIPYAPGVLSLPTLKIAVPGGEPLELPGLRVTAASILAPGETALSAPAPPLSVPGTGLIIYGTAAAILIVLFTCLGLSAWGKRIFAVFWERVKRRHLLRTMTRFLKHLDAESRAGKNKSPGEYLSILTEQFREFLSLFAGTDCRSLTAGEFLAFPLHGDFLCAFFRRCDRIRFGGGGIERRDMAAELEEVRSFIGILIQAETERPAAGEAS